MQGRTYRYFAGKPLYSFGYGLSYTTFAYRNLKLASLSLAAGDSPRVEADVENTGAAAGDEVVEVYLTQPKGFETPRRVLAGFTRVHLAPHATTHVNLTVDPRSLGQVDAKGNRVIVPGEYVLTISSAQPEDSTQVLAARFRVTGTKQLDK